MRSLYLIVKTPQCHNAGALSEFINKIATDETKRALVNSINLGNYTGLNNDSYLSL